MIVLALSLAVWALWRTVRDQPVITRQLIGGAVIELAIVVQMIIAGILLGTTGHDLLAPVTFWGYLVVSLLILPAAAVVAVVERTRWSSAALLIACGTVAIMQVRVHQLWGGAL